MSGERRPYTFHAPMQSLLDHALAYAAVGWHVFPCAPGDKVPLTSNGHHDATTDAEQIRRWWSSIPQANIGIALAPSKLVVLDVDVGFDKLGKQKPGAASLAELEREIGTLPETLAQRTARAGLHAVFARPDDVEPKRRIGFKPGLDLLGEGYIIAQPSRLAGTAFEGAPAGATGAYAWVDPAKPPAALPAALAQAAQRGSKPKVLATGGEVGAPIVTGDRNNALFRLGCSLRDTGLDEQALTLALLATNAQRFQPPLDEPEVYAVAASVMRRVAPSRDVAANALFADVFKAPLDTLGRVQEEQRAREEARTPDPLQAYNAIDEKGFTLAGEVALRRAFPVKRYSTGIPELDALIGGGISTRQLLALLGPPAAGKSAFLISLILAIEPLIPVVYASTELEADEIAARLAAPTIGCPWKAIIEDAHDGPLRVQMRAVLASKRIAIIGCDEIPPDGNAALEHIATVAVAVGKAYGTKPAIIVDYLQDLARGGEETGVRHRVGGAARLLRVMSQILDCPVIAVSSVSRASYGSAGAALRSADNPMVYLNAAKESGDVDYAAATVLYLDVGDEEDADGWKAARVAVAKARHGRTGFAGVKFHGATGRWAAEAANVVVMSRESQGGAKVERKNAEDDETVINKVRVLNGQGEGALKSKSALREVCGINKGRAEKAIERALGDGRLVLRDVEIFDRFHKPRRVNVVDLPGAAAPVAPSAPSTPTSDPVLAKMLGRVQGT